jgi:hypothetical protein
MRLWSFVQLVALVYMSEVELLMTVLSWHQLTMASYIKYGTLYLSMPSMIGTLCDLIADT